jgi:hypothetical protein
VSLDGDDLSRRALLTTDEAVRPEGLWRKIWFSIGRPQRESGCLMFYFFEKKGTRSRISRSGELLKFSLESHTHYGRLKIAIVAREFYTVYGIGLEVHVAL